ncbi:stage II sporulation protein P [Amedibacillus dolichus]|uniref:Stage II sporulation protein P n=1 Tax=Amedibacillus dolichus TaxID=31971 RepID=A0ABT7U9C7_9FIRM|nr:stage II sporulation protein P [Amedibacillus dolichus]MDM8156204.1 stage II sporulation protein P [Amedibacillus dolichus]
MRSGFKLLAKLLALVLFLLYTPFFEGMRQLVESSHFLDLLVVRQESAETSFSLKGQLNVLSVPKQEEGSSVVEQTISTSQHPVSVPQIEDKVSNGKWIYIYDTHQSEAYSSGETVLDGAQLLGELLEEAGFEVVVETNSFADYMKANGLNYNDSYLVSANFLSDVLVNYGPFDLIIDFHRDAVPRESSYVTIDGKDYARMMFVVGGLSANSEQTKQISQTLYDNIEQIQPGIMKKTMVREAYYNQEMSEHMILVEVGSDNNTFSEVRNSVEVLAEGITVYLSQ